MYKVKHSSKNITPFGGLNLIYDAVIRSGIDEFIDSKLGSRNIRATYSYSDTVLSLFGTSIAQGSFLADIEQFKSKFSQQVFNNIPSADTVEYICQELKLPNTVIRSKNEITHDFNYNQVLNETLIALAVKLKQLRVNESNTLDFDNVVIPTEKQDARMSYKKELAYHPNISFIGRLPVHIENHNGNTPARYQQKETLERCFDNLDKNGVRVDYFRADSASCQADVFELIEKRGKYFYIRMIDFAEIRFQYSKITNWKKVEINNHIKEVAHIYYQLPKSKKAYRLVVTRHKRDDSQIALFTESAYTYQAIITNDEQASLKTVIDFYNDRGDSEKSNCYLLNDFNLCHLPFPDMDTNTVYMYLMAMCAIMFEWTKTILVENNTPGVTIAMRTKAICFHYVMIAAIIVTHARERILNFFSPVQYEILKI